MHRRDVPRGPAARRVRADREGPRAGADHRLDAHLRRRVARRERLVRRSARSRVAASAASGFRRDRCRDCNPRVAAGRSACACGESAAPCTTGRCTTHSRPSSRRPPGSSPRRCPGGAEIPFELDATPTRSAPLYCYRPLTGRFIAQRIGMLARLPSYPAAAQRARAAARPARLPAPARPPRARRRRARAAPTARCRRSSARSGPTPPTSSSTPSASRAAYAELEEAAYAGCALSVVHHARRGPRDRVRRGAARRRARARARRRRSPTRPPALRRRPARRPSRCSRWRARAATAARSRPPAAACAGCRPRCGCGTTPSPRSARPPGRAPTAAPWMAIPLATGLRRPAGDCLLTAEEEDPLRAFCGLVARRTPRAGELAWALRRFELGCERGSAVEALTDWLLGRPRAVRRRRPHRLRRRRRAARRDLRRGARPRRGSRTACARRSRSSAPRWPASCAPAHEVDALVVRARRLPARRPARRPLRPPRPGPAPGRRRPAA